jgi:tetratricopeptide (TPR) repeat protein
LVARRKLLVVLDNAATVEQVRPLLPGTSSCLVLITSRDSLTGLVADDGAHRIRLDRMTVDEAEGLLAKRLGHRAAEDAVTASLIERCARLPLALCIAAERISERGSSSVVDLNEELADEQHRLNLLDTGDPHTSVRAVLSWSYRQLSPAAARLFRICGLRPGHDIDLHALSALAGDDVWTTRRRLDVLVRAHLVEQTERHRYQQHDLLWTYAAELAHATDLEQERTAALARLLDHYRHVASVATDLLYPEDVGLRPRVAESGTPVPNLAGPKDAEAWLEANHAGLLAAATYAGDHGWPAHTGDIAGILARHIRRRARHSDAFSLYSQALTAARTVGDRSDEHAALVGLGYVLRMTGRYTQAAAHLLQALAIAHELGDPNEELLALGGLGDTYFTTGQHRLATEYYLRMLAVSRRAGCRLGVLKALAGLGHSNMWSGRYAEGVDYYRQSLDVVQETGFRTSGLTAILGLAHAHIVTGRYRQAAERNRQGLRLSREIGHRVGELSALTMLGQLDERNGHHDEAAQRYEQALAIARAVGTHSNEVHLLVRLGHVHREAGRYAQAAELLWLAHTSAHACDHHVGMVVALDGLGRTSCATGDLSTALAHHRDGLALAEKLELPRERAAAHDGIAHVHLALGEPEQARRHWEHALDISHDLGLPEARAVHDRLAEMTSSASCVSVTTHTPPSREMVPAKIAHGHAGHTGERSLPPGECAIASEYDNEAGEPCEAGGRDK